jgi:hypothetical protein
MPSRVEYCRRTLTIHVDLLIRVAPKGVASWLGYDYYSTFIVISDSQLEETLRLFGGLRP